MKTNLEKASEMLDVIAADMLARGFDRRLIRTHRSMLQQLTPAILRRRAKGFLSRAVTEERKDPEHGRIYRELSAVFALAAEPDPGVDPGRCCAADHQGALAPKSGDRRDDCALVSSCLRVFLKRHAHASTAHCPRGCSSYSAIKPETLVRRGETSASFVSDGRVWTGTR